MAFNFDVNPVAINSTSKTVENLVKSIKLQDKIVEIDSNGQEIVTADSEYDGLGKVTVNVDVPSSGSGFDFTQIGYTSEENTEVNDELKAQVAYSKSLYDEWDPQTTSATMLYEEDTKLVYAPHIDTSNVTDMSNMFSNDINLKYVPSLNTSKVTTMQNMFHNCVSLEEIPDFDYSKVKDVSNMFADTKIRAFQANLPLVTDASNMFARCANLQDVTITFGNEVVDLSTFLLAANIDNLHFNNPDGIQVSNLSNFMAQSTNSTNGLDLSSIKFLVNSCSSVDSAFEESTITVAPVFEGTFSPSYINRMFYKCSSLTSVGDISFDATSLSYIFGLCARLQTIGTLNVPNVTTIYYCFSSCASLTTIGGLVGLKTDVDFSDCENLSNESIQNLIDNAADVSSTGTKTMTFNATPFATITEEQTAAATAKGWTLASA